MIVQAPITIPPQYSPNRRINASQVVDNVEFTNKQHPDPVSAAPLGKRSSNFLDWLVCLLPFLFLITILICMCFVIGSRVQHFKPEEAHNTLQRFKDNLKLAPIVDVKLPTPTPAEAATAAAAGPAAAEAGHHNLHSHFNAVPPAAPKPGECQQGYEKALLGQWGGVNSGCVCEDGTTKDQNDCQESQKCYKVSAQDPVPFKNWLKTELCVKRAPKWKWHAEACPTGEKQCGGNICIPTADTCPVSKLKQETATSDSTIKIGENNYSVQHEASPPIVNFEAVPGLETNRQCYNSAVLPQFQSKLSYSLARVPATGCGEFKALEQPDVVIGHAPVSKIHEENGLKAKLESIKFYDKAHQAEDLYQLESVLRINVKNDKKCASVHPDQIDSMQTQASSLFGTEKGMSTAIFVIALIGIIIAVIVYLMRERVFGSFDMANLHLPKPLSLIALIVAILCIILGSIYIHNVNGDDGLANTTVKVQQYNQDECFPDAGLKKAITEYGVFAKNTFATTYSWIITAFALSIVFVVLLILLVVLQHSKGLKALGNPWRDLTRDYQPYQ